MDTKLGKQFFRQDAAHVAKNLIGKVLCVKMGDTIARSIITETEAYFGSNDSASRAYRGRTKLSEPMFRDGGTIGVYLTYGMHYMFNITTGVVDDPQAVLLRATSVATGPGRLTKAFNINMADNMQDICNYSRIWIEDHKTLPCTKTPRIGIGSAKPCDQNKLLRFVIKN